MFFEKSKEMKDKPYLWKKNNNKFESLSWEEIELSVKSVARSLIGLGILKGDRVIILSENRPEWQIADLAIMSIGAITVPVYTTSTTADYSHVINHSGARCMIISSHELCVKALPALESSSNCKNIIKIDADSQSYNNPVNILHWDDLNKNNEDTNYDFHEEIKSIKRTDTACIIYTSGTGGNPKGVMLSHGAMLSNCAGAKILLKNLLEGMEEIKFLSWLPLSHSYEHTLQFFTLGIGAQVYYSEGIDKLVVNMGEVSPHFMTAVPRFYDSLHTRISQGLKNQGKLSQNLFFSYFKIRQEKI
jgi:long-chain acyl-CoA synthetase